MRMDLAKRNFFHRRMSIIVGFKMFFFGIIILRLSQLQIFSYKRYKQLAQFNSIKISFTPSLRGVIYDRNKKIITGNNKYTIIIYTNLPIKQKDLDVIYKFYSILYNNDQQRVENSIQYIRKYTRNNPSINIPLYKNVSQFDLEKISFYLPDLPNVEIKNVYGRIYLMKEKFAHLIGYVQQASKAMIDKSENVITKKMYQSPDYRIGTFGIELYENAWLSGEPGINSNQVDNMSRVVDHSVIREPNNGNEIVLTVDSDMQNELFQNFDDKNGAGVVLDVNTGQILAMCSFPSFDPNVFSIGWNDTEISRLLTSSDKIMLNRSISGLYAPGSTFKPITAITGVSNGWNPNKKITCNGTFKYAGRIYHCHKEGGHGVVDLNKAIAQSCNVYFYNMGVEMEIDDIYNVSYDLGLGQTYGIGIGKERLGCIPNRDWKKNRFNQPWYGGETINSVIGQGYNQVNVLQLATYAARMAADGRLVTPNIWLDFARKNKLNVNHQGAVSHNDTNFGKYLDINALNIAKEGMYCCINSDYGALSRYRNEYQDVKICGKTGTAQVISKRIDANTMHSGVGKEYASNGLFFGYAPYDDPKFAIAVVIEKGIWGSISAGPIGMKTLAYCVRNSR